MDHVDGDDRRRVVTLFRLLLVRNVLSALDVYYLNLVEAWGHAAHAFLLTWWRIVDG